jgi:hypothetical protein|tara:strand:+ start:1271 stop:3046 length:1776 start_codon:yes stop_codon:yes gene_type:complete
MKVKLYIVLMVLMAIPVAKAQTTDTISKNTNRPAVLDLLGRNNGSNPKSIGSLPISKGRQTTPPKKSKKTVTNSAPREKSILTRALSDFVPTDQFNISVIKDEIYEITEYSTEGIRLPGVLVDGKPETQQTIELKEERFAVRLEIDTTGVQGDIGFFERLMYNTLDLNLSKDKVTVKIWDFPYAEVNKPKKRIKATNTELVYTPSPEEESAASYYLKQWWTWLIVIVILGLIIFLIVRGRKGKNEEDEGELVIDNSSFRKMSLSAMDKAPISLKVNEFKKLLVENPEAVSSFMENIIETGQEDATTVFSTLSKPFPDLVSRLKPHMSYSTYLTLLNKIDEDIEEKIDPDTKDKFLLTFNNTVRAIANEKNSIEKTPDHKIFGFIEQLNDVQIFKLIEKDKPELASVLFAQLPDDRKLKIMDLLDHVQRSEILLKLTDMSRLPLSVIKEIGQRYAKRAKEMAGLYNIDIDGIGAIISTLDELEENKQRELLETMLQNDLDKGQIVEQKFVGFFNIKKLEETVVQNALMDIETQDILNALFNADNETVESLLKARPPREREMIRSELEAGNTISNKQRAASRKIILNQIRKFV